jgi:uncharacterized protein YecT (DUF1311 family)
MTIAAALLLASCGSDDSDRLPDDLTAAEGVDRPDDLFENQAEGEAESPPPNADTISPTPAEANSIATGDEDAAPPPSDVAQPTPSFDCDGALNRVETMVCGDSELARLDRRLARDYDRALGEALPEQRQRLTNLGRRYLADRNRCSTRDCVVQAYRWYLRDIETLMSAPDR